MSQSQDLLENARPYLQMAVQKTRELPIFTLGITIAMSIFFLFSTVLPINSAFSLKPSDIPAFEFSRLTTYPLTHVSLLQYIFSVGAFVPLCGRFERKYGSLRSLAMFLGPFESVPGLLYCLVDGAILKQDTAITGCSGFVFTMISIEVLQNSREALIFGGRQIPVYAVPFFCLVLTTLLLPNSSFLCHCTAIFMGFVFGSGRVDFLLLPLNVVNFVERRANAIFSRIPGYVTAEAASTPIPSLPTEEPGGYHRASAGTTDASESIPLQRVSTTGSSGSKQPAVNLPSLSPNNGRPVIIRQTSGKWNASERED